MKIPAPITGMRSFLSATEPFANVTPYSSSETISWYDGAGNPRERQVGPKCNDIDLVSAQRSRDTNRYQYKRNYEGNYWCAGTGGHVWYESMTEYSAIMHLDHTSRLAALTAQPCCIRFKDGTQHYPDFYAEHHDGRKVLYDVRPLKFMDEKTQHVFSRTAEVCDSIGWGYEIIHEIGRVERHNLEWLAAYRHPWNAPHPETVDQIAAFVSEPRPLEHVAQLLHFVRPAKFIHHVYHLMWQQQLSYDNRLPISWETELIWNPDE